MTIKHSLLAGVAILSVAIIMPVAVYAHEGHAHSAHSNAQEHQSTARETSRVTMGERREIAQTKLTEAKLKACQNRQKVVAKIMTRMTERAQKHVDLFGTIADRTKTFYVDQNKALADYEELVADVEAKRVNAQTLVDSAKATTATFDCNGEDPKGVISSFKATAQNTRDALQEYRTAVKNLIVGVKSVQGTTSSEEGTSNETTE